LSWRDGKYHNGTLLFENMDFLLRDGGVGGIFSTSDANLSSAVAVRVEDVENTLDLEVLAQIRQQAEEEKADWNLYFTQYYNVITSAATPSNTTVIGLCMLIVLVKYVRERLQRRRAAVDRQTLAEIDSKNRTFLLQLQIRVVAKRDLFKLQRQQEQRSRYYDNDQQNKLDGTGMPLHPIKSARESQHDIHVTGGVHNAQNNNTLRLRDRSVLSLQDGIDQQLHVLENSVDEKTGMPSRPENYRMMNPSEIYNNRVHYPSKNKYKTPRKIPDSRQNISETRQHFRPVWDAKLLKFQEISDLIDFNISRA